MGKKGIPMNPKKEKLFALMTAACLSAGLMTQPAAAVTPTIPENWKNTFSDVKGDEWFVPAIAVLNDAGVMNGTPEGKFLPYGLVDAGQAILLIDKAVGMDRGPLEARPGDPHYASRAVKYAVKYGWVKESEVPEDLNTPVTRLYISTLAAKALGLKPVKGQSPFADLDDGYVTALYQKGLVGGSEENGKLLFNPNGNLTRVEISAMICNIMDYMEDHIYYLGKVMEMDPDVPVFSYDKSAFARKGQKMTYSGSGYQTSWGIDVSHHQQEIDWQAVANDGVDFAIVRAAGRGYGAEGNLYEDSRVHQNLQGALDAGLEVGTYFFSQAITVEEAREEAALLLDLIKDYPITGPVVFDSEDNWGTRGRTHFLTPAQLSEIANAFCEEVEKAGYQPMIYFNRQLAYRNYDLGQVAQYPFWLAEYENEPSFRYHFDMWQYTSSGKVKGINGKVDMNLWLKPIP